MKKEPDLWQAISQQNSKLIEVVRKNVVAVEGRPRVASSGLIWKKEIIITALHTLRRNEGITIRSDDGKHQNAAIVGKDRATDIAVLRVDGLEATEISTTHSVKTGEIVLTIGRTAEDVTAALAMIAGIRGPFRTWHGQKIEKLYRLDIQLFSGFSGSSVWDPEGKLIGMNTTAFARNVGITIPSATIESITETILKKGKVARGYLGLAMQPVSIPAKTQSNWGIQQDVGLMVFHVEPDGPADRAGILMGDLLLKLQDRDLTDFRNVQDLLGPDSIGKTLPANVIRGGKQIDVSIEVGER
jgi:S1-C subfamily serine protease